MARRSRAEAIDETQTEETTVAEQTDTQYDDTMAGPEDDVIELNEDEFAPVLWPTNTDICVYINRPRRIISGPQSKQPGAEFLGFEAVVREDQIDPVMEEFAGESMDVMLSRQKGRNGEYHQLLMVLFGEIPSRFRASDLANLCVVIRVRHGKDSKNPGQLRMYLDQIKADKTVEQ